MDKEKATTYAIIGASVIGIIIVAFLVLTNVPMGSYFSELYFEDHAGLPRGVQVGEKVEFNFTVVSHEKNITTYNYLATFGDRNITTNSFTLDPGENATVGISFSPQEPTLRYITSETSKETKHLIFNRQETGKILLVREDGSVKQINLNKSQVDILAGTDEPIWTGDKVQMDIIGQNKVDLNLNSRENYTFSYSTKETTNSSVESTPFLSEERLANFSSYGYNLINKTMEIKNNRGDILITQETNTSKYRYEKKKVEVNVTTDTGKEYEIHFWTIVK